MFVLQIIFNQHYLVRPNIQTGGRDNNNKKDKPNSLETASSSSSATATTATTTNETNPVQHEFIFSEAVLLKVGKPLKEVIEKVMYL